jgi:hypothetical protein
VGFCLGIWGAVLPDGLDQIPPRKVLISVLQ